MKNKKNIALIFFSRTSSDEGHHKLWFSKDSKNNDVASLLINKAKGTLSQTGLPVYHFDEKNQIGNTFGERLANAYQEVFNLGYDQVISVGNDCPDLEKINWQNIVAELEAGHSVLGPDKRGGAYLIGLQKISFNKTKFEHLNWQKNTLYSELTKLCKDFTHLVELNQYRDINSCHDLRFLLAEPILSKAFLKLIALLFRPLDSGSECLKSKTSNFHIFSDSPLRAPPLKILSSIHD